jgi:hypothetical protein
MTILYLVIIKFNSAVFKMYVSERTKEIGILVVLSLITTVIVITTIVIITNITGNQELINQMLQNTAEGQIEAISITVGGPFGMWFIALLGIWYVRSKIHPSDKIELYLRFSRREFTQPGETIIHPPSSNSAFREARCYFSIFSNDDPIIEDKEVKRIHIDQNLGPYISIRQPAVENPQITVKMTYRGRTWDSHSYTPFRGFCELQ